MRYALYELCGLDHINFRIYWGCSHAKDLWPLFQVGLSQVEVFDDPENINATITHRTAKLPSISMVLLCMVCFIEYE
jgi:hypothetical protein